MMTKAQMKRIEECNGNFVAFSIMGMLEREREIERKVKSKKSSKVS